jgi:hypothetical protein
MLLHALLS